MQLAIFIEKQHSIFKYTEEKLNISCCKISSQILQRSLLHSCAEASSKYVMFLLHNCEGVTTQL